MPVAGPGPGGDRLAGAIAAADAAVRAAGDAFDHQAELAQRRILAAFRSAGVAATDLGQGTGYGYGDRPREAVEAVYAAFFRAEAALVRPHIVSGTQALAIAFAACLEPGDTLLGATGRPYDTLWPVIAGGRGSLRAAGVAYAEVDPWAGGCFDPGPAAAAARKTEARAVLLQRSRGYSQRPALSGAELGGLIAALRAAAGDRLIVIVDNCYAELVEPEEPCAHGADLACGSMIKNPGGGIAPAGGYVVGRRDLVDLAAQRLYAPGLGAAVGPSLVPGRLLLQGFFLAPGAVAAALKTAVYAAAAFDRLGYPVRPGPADARSDIVQSIRLGRRRLVELFCQAVQGHSPIDSRAVPEFAPLPGYDHQVIMAAGTFVQGASLELSADAPDLAPHWVYLQGGLGLGYGKAAVEAAAKAVLAAAGDGL